MQGTWKENIQGWNTKDSKRKKQSRKHTLKDRAKWHIKHTRWNRNQDSAATYVEGSSKKEIYLVENRRQFKVEVWTIDVDNYDYKKTLKSIRFRRVPEGFFKGNTKIAYEWRGFWYDYYTAKPYRGLIKKLNKIDEEFVEWDKHIPKYEEVEFELGAEVETIYLYNKPIPVDYYNMFGFYTTRRRKFVQKMVNKMDRARVREWVSRENWDTEIKTHALSKSIAWEIY